MHAKVAVLGGSGFLGAHVVEAFARKGYEVDGCSRATGVDARDEPTLLAYLRSVEPEVLINCTHHGGGIAYNARNPVAIFEDNLLTGFHALRAAAKSGVKKFVNLLGNSTYPGDLGRHQESAWWNGALHPSVISSSMPRKAHWAQGWAHYQETGFCSIHLVLPNLYGPGDHLEPTRSHALAALIRKIWEAKQAGADKVEIWGTGKPIREWLYVEDAAEGITLAAERYNEIEILNLGSGQGCSVHELAGMIGSILDWRGDFVFDPSRPDGAACKVADVRKMKAVLGWVPPTGLREGLEKTIQWFLSRRSCA
jgi:GDP-L-fucose synthase